MRPFTTFIEKLSLTLAILWASQGFAADINTSLEGIPLEGLDQIKLIMEDKLKEVSGHPLLCKEEVKECIQGYNSLLSMDWKESQLEKGKKIVVSSHLPTSAREDYYVINTQETPEVLKRYLGATVDSAAEMAIDLLQALQHFQEISGQPCPGQPPAPPPLPCPDKEKYYDKLFKSGELNTTIVWGYFDEHEEGFLGYLKEQLFHLKKIPISIEENQDELDQMLSLLRAQGFQLESTGPTEWHLARPFYYKGEKKIARVSLYNSTVLCPGETVEAGTVERFDNQTCDAQKAATATSLSAFKSAFEKNQLVVYNGHSRLGRGPDFGPLGLSSGKFPIAKGALNLVDLENKQTILYMGSCNSLDYYEKGVQRRRATLSDPDNLKMLGIKGDGSWGNSAEEASRLIQMVMEARCPRDITDAINLPKSVSANYQIDFDSMSAWMKSREPAGAKNQPPVQHYQLATSADGSEEACYPVGPDGVNTQNPVDEHLCATRYTSARSSNGKRSCYLADENEIPFGQPVSDEFCSE